MPDVSQERKSPQCLEMLSTFHVQDDESHLVCAGKATTSADGSRSKCGILVSTLRGAVGEHVSMIACCTSDPRERDIYLCLNPHSFTPRRFPDCKPSARRSQILRREEGGKQRQRQRHRHRHRHKDTETDRDRDRDRETETETERGRVRERE